MGKSHVDHREPVPRPKTQDPRPKTKDPSPLESQELAAGFSHGKIPVIGILGGVASGKSLVAGQLGEMGAGILDADRVGHEVLRMAEVKRAALERWGPGILGSDGEIERSALAKVVFAAPPDGSRERSFLEQITHPKIERRLQDEAERMAAAGCRAIVLDAALLLEAGWNRLCDTLIFVDVPRSERCRRAHRRGWSESDFAAREEVQEALDLKREHADAIIDNAGTPEGTRMQLKRVWHSLLG